MGAANEVLTTDVLSEGAGIRSSKSAETQREGVLVTLGGAVLAGWGGPLTPSVGRVAPVTVEHLLPVATRQRVGFPLNILD